MAINNVKLETFKERFLELVRNLREREIADKLKIGKSSAHYYKSGERVPKITSVYYIASAFGVDPRWLAGEDVPKYPAAEEPEPVAEDAAEPEDTGYRIKELRARRKLSIAKLAAKSGVSAGQITRIETGTRNLTEAVAEKLANALDVEADWLLYGDTEPTEVPMTEAEGKFQIKGGRPTKRQVVQAFADDAKIITKMAKEHGISQADVLHQILQYCLKHS